jgi:DNA gyrase/topoisomerase IV subunit B
MVRKNKDYTSEDIRVLSEREHVRLRTQVYLGNTKITQYQIPVFRNDKFAVENVEFVPAVFKAVGEILDNCIDEFAHIDIANKKLTIAATPLAGVYEIGDNGRGVPIDKHEVGKFTPEVVFGSLRSGRNFKDEKEIGVIGQNGVGSACTNYCSSSFAVEVNRDGKRYTQTFTNGAEEVSKPSIRNTGSNKTGTTITFTLDKTVFESIMLPDILIQSRAMELALTNPGVSVTYNGNTYKYKKGFDDIIKDVSKDFFKFEKENMEFYVVFDANKSADEQVFTWVNSSLLFDGGLCNTQFINAFVDKTIEHLAKDAKREKCEITKNDVRRQLLVLGNLKISDPQYDSQAKTRLTGPNLRDTMKSLVEENWSLFARRNKDWLERVLKYATSRYHRDADDKAMKEMQKRKKVPGLVDATSKNIFERQLLITEGDSAASMITEARDPKTTASLPLSGKINNVYDSTIAQVVNMGKMTDLLSAIGLVPGQKAVRSNLRYGKIVIATDADVDGGDIFTLLVNLFYKFWPELFDPAYEPIVYRLLAPNVCLIKGDKRIHFVSRAEYEKSKDQYKGWTVKYYKGLGSMATEDWEMILSGKTNTLTPIVNDGNMEDVLTLLFGPDANLRKQWLQGK